MWHVILSRDVRVCVRVHVYVCYVAVLAGLLDDSTWCDICVRITSLSRTCKVLREGEGGREGRGKEVREGRK